jgi:outer membrane protein
MDTRKAALWMATSCIAIMLSVGSGFAADVAKIGILDAQRVLEVSSAGKAAQARINAAGTQKTEDLKQKAEEFKALEEQLKREAMVMSQEKRDDKSRELKIRKVEIEDLQKKYSREMGQMQKELLGQIQADIVELAQEIGKEDGYLLILTKENAVYYPSSIDITDKLIQNYNAKFAKGKTEASKAE